jgi:UDP-GlcNAc:undecaprenyl-phosphate GlcNAc-1-phosphate transferase
MIPQQAIIILFFGALVIAIALTPISKWLAPRVGMVSHPRTRDVHTIPVPRMGGVAIFIAVMVCVVLFATRFEFRQLAAMVIGAAFVSFLGLLDDRFTLSAYIRLIAQLGAAFMMWYSGVGIQLFNNPFADALITMIWIVGITNAMNFLDNMDGLLAGVSAIIATFCLVLSVMNGQILVGALSAALVGACVGFLFYNLNPANVFMGDSGSMFLGFLLACLAIKLRFAQSPTVSWLVPLALLGLPIFDTTLVVISRLRRGLNPLTTPGKDHTSHRITYHGFTKRESVMMLYIVSGAFGIMALLISQFEPTTAYLVCACVFAIALYMLWFMEFGPWKLITEETIKK